MCQQVFPYVSLISLFIFIQLYKQMSTQFKPLSWLVVQVLILLLAVSIQQNTQINYEMIQNAILQSNQGVQLNIDSSRSHLLTHQLSQHQGQEVNLGDIKMWNQQTREGGEQDTGWKVKGHQPIVYNQEQAYESHYHAPSESQFWWNLLLSAVLTITGAFCSGMTVGFCNIDKLQLQVMTMSRNPQEKKMARTIQEVVGNHHLWLVTLLVYNAVALQSLPLVVHTLMPDWLAIIFSTIIVLIAAQIVPQAICTGPKKMIIAYRAAPIVHIMRKCLFFIIHPMAIGLDYLLGKHQHTRIQHKDFATFLTGNKILKQTEKMLLTSTLQLRCQRVMQKMVPLKKLYMFECSQLLTTDKIDEMLKKDYSHVLVYRVSKQDIVGVIKVKQFAFSYLKNQNRQLKAEQVMNSNNPFLSVYMDTNLLQMLMLFQANSNRIALICDEKKKIATSIPSIMYTKNDMIMKKKGVKIVGAIFLYQIFDELTDLEENAPQQVQGHVETQMKDITGLHQPLIQH